jgi:hypothetical protein
VNVKNVWWFFKFLALRMVFCCSAMKAERERASGGEVEEVWGEVWGASLNTLISIANFHVSFYQSPWSFPQISSLISPLSSLRSPVEHHESKLILLQDFPKPHFIKFQIDPLKI